MRLSRRSPGRRGILLYVGLGLMMVLSVLGSALMYVASWQEENAMMVYEGEVITNLAEAAVEEVFHNFEQELNESSGSKIYKQLREPWKPDDVLELDGDYMAKASESARKLAQQLYKIDPKEFLVEGRIDRMQQFQILQERGLMPDPIEKDAAISVKVTITFRKLTKVVVVSRPLKVVRCTIPVLSECTLFVNNLEPQTFAKWPSIFGYQDNGFPEPQTSLVLDHGWAKYSTTNTKADFIKHFEEEVLNKGAVPPGRVFVNKGVVPLTNGNLVSGMLQKQFHSAETELLPQQFEMPLKQLKEFLEGQARSEADGSTRLTSDTGDMYESVEGGEGTSSSAGATASSSDAIPDTGKLVIRYLGHGWELELQDSKEHMSKSEDGFATWFKSYVEADWKKKGSFQRVSGLDLFGRVEEKAKGEGLAEEEGGNWFTKALKWVKKMTKSVLEKIWAKYQIKISPTIVYGECLHTYFAARDYVETGWLEKMKNTVTLAGNETSLPYFPPRFLDSKDETKALSEPDLPEEWDKKLKKRWAKMPEEIRKPRFYKVIDKVMFPDFRYNLADPAWKPMLDNLPVGTIIRPYNVGLVEFLAPPPESKIRQVFSGLSQQGIFFLENMLDWKIPDNVMRGPFKAEYKAPLSEFNPFLYYVKATEYISSLNDPRVDPKDPRHDVFRRKFLNEKEGVLNLHGVIYVTGTEPLRLGNVRYKGKAILITFGPVVFTGFVVKSQDSADDPEKNDLLTIVSLGGIDIRTSQRIDAQLYSYIYPFKAKEPINVFGGMGCNDLSLEELTQGGTINFDWTYHVPVDMDLQDRKHYYYVAITEEIKKFEYTIRRTGLLRDQPED